MLSEKEKEVIMQHVGKLHELPKDLKTKLKKAIKNKQSPFDQADDDICCDTGTDVGTRYITSSRDACTSLGWTVVANSYCNL